MTETDLGKVQKKIRFLMSESLALAEKRRGEIASGRVRNPRDTDKSLAGCIDCGMHIHAMAYMVHIELWESVGLDKRQLCCEDCLAIRIGRPLEISDYTTAIINLPYFRGYEMAMRNEK